MATGAKTKTVTISMSITIPNLGEVEALLIKDLLLGDRSGTMLSDNMGIYDYSDLVEKVEEVVIS